MGVARVNAIHVYLSSTKTTDRLTLTTTLQLDIEEAFTGTNVHAKTE